MRAYYNENDAYCAQWLRNLIAAGLIPDGEVDDRSILDVKAGDLDGFTQCHFFAGLGGWSRALELAAWPASKSVWTGSCPCQPLSSAGQRKGHADERHLWPAFYRLIAECKPAMVFGEQVASKDGREWFSGVRADLEALGYALGAADLCAASVGAPHIRQRLWFVAESNGHREHALPVNAEVAIASQSMADADQIGSYGSGARSTGGNQSSDSSGAMADADGGRCSPVQMGRLGSAGKAESDGYANGTQWSIEPDVGRVAHGPSPRLVRVCAACLQKGAIDESVRDLLKAAVGHEGREPSQILQPSLHGNGAAQDTNFSGDRTLSSTEAIPSRAMRKMRIKRPAPSSSPQGRERNKQPSNEHRDSLRAMPCASPSEAEGNLDMHRLQGAIRGEGSSQPSQDLLCDVCGGVGKNLRAATLGSNRVHLLRALGNAIVPQVAAEFIGAYLNAEAAP